MQFLRAVCCLYVDVVLFRFPRAQLIRSFHRCAYKALRDVPYRRRETPQTDRSRRQTQGRFFCCHRLDCIAARGDDPRRTRTGFQMAVFGCAGGNSPGSLLSIDDLLFQLERLFFDSPIARVNAMYISALISFAVSV